MHVPSFLIMSILPMMEHVLSLPPSCLTIYFLQYLRPWRFSLSYYSCNQRPSAPQAWCMLIKQSFVDSYPYISFLFLICSGSLRRRVKSSTLMLKLIFSACPKIPRRYVTLRHACNNHILATLHSSVPQLLTDLNRVLYCPGTHEDDHRQWLQSRVERDLWFPNQCPRFVLAMVYSRMPIAL